MAKINNEKDVQNFIAKYPWLLDLKYQNVPVFNKNGLEYYIEGKKRTDLILKDNVTNCPVVVEFKYWDLKREDIGQILEYKARIFTSFNDENSELFRIFGKNIYSPKLVLVVRSSDEFGRMACNLQNVELFEFGNLEKRIIEDIPFINKVSDFSKSLKEYSPAITEDRYEYLENNVINVIKKVFEKYNISNKWKNYRNANLGEWLVVRNLILDRSILPDETIQVGIYEDIIEDKDMSVCITFYTWLDNVKEIKEYKTKLNKLEKSLRVKTNLANNIKKKITFDEEDKFEYWLICKYKYKDFYQNVEKIIEFNISNYLKIFEI